MSEESRGSPLHGSVENENTNKNEDDEDLRSEFLRDLPDWPQEFKESLLIESVPAELRGNPSHEHRDTSGSSHELPLEPRAKVASGSGKHRVIFLTSRETEIVTSA